MTIHTQAMLAHLTISQWTAKKLDRNATAQVELTHQAHDAGRFTKALLSKQLFESINQLISQARKYHYSVTLPWTDGGDRLLPTSLFAEHTKTIRAFRSEFQAAVKTAFAAYPAEVNAARARLGSMYDPADYPAVHELHEKFDMAVTYIQVPEAKDFRVDVAQDVAEDIRTEITANIGLRQNAALQECYRRVQDIASKLYERLSSPDAIFKDSLLTNAADLAVLLPSFNLTNDAVLTELHNDVQTLLQFSPNELRHNLATRTQAAALAKIILNKLPCIA